MESNNEQNKTAILREARRKRILENSNNRLGKITGRVHNEGKINNYLDQCKLRKLVFILFEYIFRIV